MNRLCTILARAGSVGVPGKNVRRLGGIPLIAHTIRQAQSSGLFGGVAVSSDDPMVTSIASAEGVDFIIERPAPLATAHAPKLPALLHCVEEAERDSGQRFEVVVDLQPTSPLRLTSDIESAVEQLERHPDTTNVVSVGPAKHSPYSTLVEVDRSTGYAGLIRPTRMPPTRRQDDPEIYALNGSIYVWNSARLTSSSRVIDDRTRLSIMPEERSIDIDTPFDWFIVEQLYERPDLWRKET